MMTLEKSERSKDLMFRLMNTFREKPITVQGYKNQRAKEVKSNKNSYNSATGGLVPFSSSSVGSINNGCITSIEMNEILGKEE